MAADLPPWHALHTFEVAARLGSFSKAATHLHVTTSAVSKQVALLERHLRTPLFVRTRNSVQLTDRGRLYAHAVTRGFSQLASDIRGLERVASDTVKVVVDSDFAQLWLLSRLPDLQRRHPGLQVRIHSRLAVMLEDLGEFDAALIWGQGDWLDSVFEPLFTNLVFPVCAPSLLSLIRTEEGQPRLTSSLLIHDRDSDWWARLLRLLKLNDVDPAAGQTFDQTVLCLEAAAAGQGITVGDEVSTRPYLESGRLVIPFDVQLPSPFAYYWVTARSSDRNYALPLLRQWLFERAEEHRQWCTNFWNRYRRSNNRLSRRRSTPQP